MPYAIMDNFRYHITYSNDVAALSLRAKELYDTGLYHEFIYLDELGNPRIKAERLSVAYAEDGNVHSLTLTTLPPREVYGDPDDPDFVPFVVALGIEVLSSGENRGGENCPYRKLQQGDPAKLAKYKIVKPDIIEVDEDGKPTGVTRFNGHGEWARTPR